MAGALLLLLVVLLAGGCSGQEPQDRPAPSAVPVMGASHELVPDPADEGVLLLTGPPEEQPAGEPMVLWRWDGDAWSTVEAEGEVPPARSYFAAAYDADREVVVLYGGDLPAEESATVWEWDGEAWTATPGGAPGPRLAAATTYDPESLTTIVHGGDDGRGSVLNDTWAWDGTTWDRLPGPGPRPPRFVGAIVAPPGGDPVQLGGHQVVSEELPPALADTWVLVGDGWRPVPDAGGPGDTVNARGLVHPELGPVVVGGSDMESERGDVWSWDGMTWRLVGDDVFPARQAFGLAYDAGRDVVVMTGGVVEPGSTERHQDVWEWNGDPATPAEAVGGDS